MVGSGGGNELQGSHAALADITQPFHRIEVARTAAPCSQPGVDESVAEAVGE